MDETFGESFLRKKGYLKQQKLTDTVIKKHKVIIDTNNQLAFASVPDKQTAQDLFKEMKNKYFLDFYWFSYNRDTCLVVYKRYGENNYFAYDPKNSPRKSIKGKLSKIEKIGTDGLRPLFDTWDLVDQFYQELWNYRENIADNIKNDFSIKNKLYIAQRYIDRFIFINFLVQKKLIALYRGNKPRAFPLIRFLKTRLQKNKKNFSVELKWLFDLLDDTKKRYPLDVEGEQSEIYVPHLDGGLFDSDFEVEGVPEKKFLFDDNKINWENILDVFGNYNWIITVDDIKFEEDELFKEKNENITPEILGHIYEKFAISLEKFTDDFYINDKKEVKNKINEAKRGKGVYYTPEEITLYISQNSIWPCLRDKVQAQESNFQEFLENNRKSRSKLKKALEILKEITICDPACGSGAFLLQAAELLYDWEKRIIIELNERLNTYEIKKNIVLRNIYGVDIQPGSVEIAKLRLWLWFSSEQEAGKVEQLPNLEYNIMEGNSLIGFTSFDAKHIHSNRKLSVSLSEIEELKEEYKEDKSQEKKKKKRRLSKMIEEVRREVDDIYISELNYKGLKIKPEVQQKYLFDNNGKEATKNNYYKKDIYSLKPFHWAIEFSEIFNEGGFDIIIGNPPYVSKHSGERNKIEQMINALNFNTLYRDDDLYMLFLERCDNISREKGIIGFITSNTFIVSISGSLIRAHLCNKRIIKLIDFKEYKVFKGASNYVQIIIYANQQNSNDEFMCVKPLMHKHNWKNESDVSEIRNLDESLRTIFPNNRSIHKNLIAFTYTHRWLSSFIKYNQEVTIKRHQVKVERNVPFSDSWVLLPKGLLEIYLQIEKKTNVRLSPCTIIRDNEEINYDKSESLSNGIFVGIQTNSDNTYILKSEEDIELEKWKNKKVIKLKPQRAEEYLKIETGILKAYIKPEMVSKYNFNWENTFVLFPYDSKGNLISPNELKKRYPLCWEYLCSQETLEQMCEDSKERREIINNLMHDFKCKTTKKLSEKLQKLNNIELEEDRIWYRFIYPKNITIIDEPKILTKTVSKNNCFSLDSKGIVAPHNVGVYSIPLKENMLYILGLLNSSLAEFYLTSILPDKRGGYYMFIKEYLSRLPVIIKKEKQVNHIVLNLLNKDLNEKEIEINQKKLDKIFFEIYGINEYNKILKSLNKDPF